MALPLKPNEVRTAPAVDNPEHVVTVEYVAGGSFAKVQVNDADGRRVMSHVHQFSGAAVRQFEELTTTRTADDEMEA